MGCFEYKMTNEMAEALLKERKANEKKMNKNEYLIKVVNEQFGIKGTCVGVKIN